VSAGYGRSGVLRNAFLHAGELSGRCLALVHGLPVGIGHAIHRFTPHILAYASRFAQPVTKAIAAKPRKTHQIDILRIGPVAQMMDKATKGSSSSGIINLVNLHVYLSGNSQNVC
jgi:hypothetical protein